MVSGLLTIGQVTPLGTASRSLDVRMSENDDEFIGYAFTDVARMLRTVFERRVRAYDLTRSQWVVIARLKKQPGLSQSEVADILEIEKAPAGRLIDRMEAKGWVERRADPDDRRINRLHLTPRADRIHEMIWPLAEATVDDALSDLAPEARAQLEGAIRKVKSRLQELTVEDPRVLTDADLGRLDGGDTDPKAKGNSETETTADAQPMAVRVAGNA